ncbi:MAG: hypothetical protein IJJ26_03105 [Victivallales bacterium]|nr:hypothetical protein [Victivallales bacterium]
MKKNRNFTLVELLTVIGIIVVLAGILIPAVNSAMKKAHETACASNLRQLGIAEKGYSTDNKNLMLHCGGKGDYNKGGKDQNDTWADRLYDYANDKKIFICPEANEDGTCTTQINGSSNTSDSEDKLTYVANPGKSDTPDKTVHPSAKSLKPVKVYQIVRASQVISLGPQNDSDKDSSLVANYKTSSHLTPDRHLGKRANYLMVDGHVESIDKTALTDDHFQKTTN